MGGIEVERAVAVDITHGDVTQVADVVAERVGRVFGEVAATVIEVDDQWLGVVGALEEVVVVGKDEIEIAVTVHVGHAHVVGEAAAAAARIGGERVVDPVEAEAAAGEGRRREREPGDGSD